ncbi:MAG: NAD(P)H-dependent glycerol-3-phosphate dehydrogenase [Candidatus Woesearchaeota archaeon]
MHIGIIGSGNFGTALAIVFSSKHKIVLYDVNESVVSEINSAHTNSRYLQGFTLNGNVSASTDISSMHDAELIIVSVPSKFMKDVCMKLKPYYNQQIIISVTKGLSTEGHVMTEVIEAELGCDASKVLALSGPCIAAELAQYKPTMVMLGGRKDVAMKVKNALESESFLIKTTMDKKGIQLLGFYKNIIAILMGICEGIGLGSNFESSLMTRAYNEFYQLNAAVNIRRHTFVSQAGLGDLYVTAMSHDSRNRRFGHMIGEGMSINEAKDKIGQTIEGYENVLLLHNMKNKSYIDKELVDILMEIIHNGKSREQIKDMLMKYLYNYRGMHE